MKISRKPRRMRDTWSSSFITCEGWWYEAGKSIEIYLRDESRNITLRGRIGRAILLDWIKRTQK